MIETYEVRWHPDTHHTDDYVLRDQVEAETADEAARTTTLDARSGGMIVVYKTYTADDGTIKTGNLIRRYVPDDYGYTWVPMMAITDQFGDRWRDETEIVRAMARVCDRFYRDYREWREGFAQRGQTDGEA